MNTKNNIYFKNNQKKIKNAFFELIEIKGPDSLITVTDICNRTKLNRSTFYRHYLDVLDLSEKIFIELQNEYFDKSNNSKKLEYYLSASLTIIDRNKSFFAYYLKHNNSPFMNPEFVETWQNKIVPVFKHHGVKNEINMKYYFSFFIGGFISIISDWINNGYKESKEEIYKILSNCLAYSTNV